jgi:hypothetical protein
LIGDNLSSSIYERRELNMLGKRIERDTHRGLLARRRKKSSPEGELLLD